MAVQNSINTIGISFCIYILLMILGLILLWLFIKSAVKHGTKDAIMECYQEISKIEADEDKKAQITKSIEEETKEELENW